jgi:hypothetical protein
LIEGQLYSDPYEYSPHLLSSLYIYVFRKGIIHTKYVTFLFMLCFQVLTAVFGLIGNVICMVGVRWWGKRPFSLISIAVASMASLLLGFYAYAVISPGKVATGGTSQNLSYVPLALFVVYVLMQSIGVLPIPWMILSEVFPFR